MTTWSFNDDGKKVKKVSTYKIEKKVVSKVREDLLIMAIPRPKMLIFFIMLRTALLHPVSKVLNFSPMRLTIQVASGQFCQ